MLFAEKFKLEKRDIALLQDALELVDEADYCFEELPNVLGKLKKLTKKPSVDAPTIAGIEKVHRIKVPKLPIFHRVPFYTWTQKGTRFEVSKKHISEFIFR